MMSRNTQLFAVLLSLAAAPAFAQISWEGSVLPTAPSGFPIIGTADQNQDGVVDYLFAGGNGIITDGINQTDPTGATGVGLAWDAPQVWRAFDTAQNLLVGDAGQSGSLNIAAGGNLRWQYLVIGGVSELANSQSRLNVNPDDSIRFTVPQYLATVAPGTGGVGVMTITGFGSLYSNDPNLLPQTAQTALNLAEGRQPSNFQILTNLEDEVSNSISPNPFTNFSTRDELRGYDTVVGLNGSAVLNITAGGRMEIQDALMVGVDSQANGSVVIDGIGSALVAYGRLRLDYAGAIPIVNPSVEATSFIGGRGTGSLAVTGGGRADFFNGLSIGAPTGVVLSALAGRTPGIGSGIVTVSGAGSTLNAYSSAIGGDFNRAALAVGEIRTLNLQDDFDPTADANLQTGSLTIANNAVVTTATNAFVPGGNANAAIGKRGEVTMEGGSLLVAAAIQNDGGISGYGLVRSSTLETSIYSIIRGGNPNNENPALAAPLRLVVLEDNADDALLNRGVIDGRVDIEVSGGVTNEGSMAVGGELFAERFINTATGHLRGDALVGGALRVRLNSEDAASQATSLTPALSNLGLISGSIDLISTGGLANGANLSNAATGGNAGAIRATGVMQVGTFINHRLGTISVGTGESLAILTSATTAITTSPLIVENGTTPATAVGGATPTVASFYGANLGKINVDGGRMELGRINDVTLTPIDNTLNSNLFRNARYVGTSFPAGDTNNNSVGTITSNNGELVFRNGLYNTGVVAFTGGDNLVTGRVFNSISTDFNGAAAGGLFPGQIVVSGDGTSVTFQDNVINDGVIGIGPFGSVVNFLGDLENNGAIDVAFDLFGTNGSQAAYITVGGNVTINGGTIGFAFLNSAPPASIPVDFSVALLTAGDLAEDSLFTNLVLPDLPAGKYWDVVYDTVNDEVRLEMVMSNAIGADFDGNGVVSSGDIDVWVRNAGIESGASIIQGDANHDGKVNLADYDILMTQLYTGVPVAIGGAPFSSSVPEPTSALLVLMAVAPFVRRRA